MAERKGRTPRHGRVLRTGRVTPHMIRVVIGAPGFPDGPFTDHYIKIVIPPAGVTYPEPLDLDAIRRDLPAERWPAVRTYTVRAYDPATAELTVDFVHHGDEGVAGPWAAALRPGDDVWFMGPGGGYAPSAEADWHLLAGDESALPAIAAALQRLPAGRPAWVFVEVADAAEEQPLESPGDAKVVWLHRGASGVGEALTEAVRGLDFPAGRVQAFVHGEAGFVRDLRRHLRGERGVALEQLSISGYWRLGRDDEGWRAIKRDWNSAIEAEEAAPGAAGD
jgi:NADPH-dependent ferric siderophore reductase